LRRFFVEEIRESDGTCSITGSEAKHITKVLRMKTGDRFVLMDSKGSRFQVTIESATPREVKVVLGKPIAKPPPSPVQIMLCQALLKSRQMDYLIQKTSELGVDRILPFSSERTVIPLRKDRTLSKLRHWREIAQNSAKQADRDIPVELETFSPFKKLTTKEKWKDALKVILWEQERSQDLKSLLKAFSPVKKFVGMVGPEGGFTQEEIGIASDAGFVPVTLGNRILRSETAAITMVAIIQYEWGDLSSSNLIAFSLFPPPPQRPQGE
jgi:16S rRNA (uracil1498-N3)-methyltransferase